MSEDSDFQAQNVSVILSDNLSLVPRCSAIY